MLNIQAPAALTGLVQPSQNLVMSSDALGSSKRQLSCCQKVTGVIGVAWRRRLLDSLDGCYWYAVALPTCMRESRVNRLAL
jgi:hypothetical protein